MDIKVRLIVATEKTGEIRLTTSHPASSYNQPVLVRAVTGVAYGPGEEIIGAPSLVVPWVAPAEEIAAIRAWNARVRMAHNV